MIGSACFVIGAVPGYVNLVGYEADGITFFVGSIFFTTAAFLQALQSVGALKGDPRPKAGVRWRMLVRAPKKPEWWAGVVQLGGTILFNVSTFAALETALDPVQANRRVWAPNVFGSIAFLVASALVFADVQRPWLRWRPRNINWDVAMLNMAGSIFFGLSAIGARVMDTGDLRNAELANLGTFLGGICFFVGALLLIPDAERLDAAQPKEGSAR
jgi:hypothetical protein